MHGMAVSSSSRCRKKRYGIDSFFCSKVRYFYLTRDNIYACSVSVSLSISVIAIVVFFLVQNPRSTEINKNFATGGDES